MNFGKLKQKIRESIGAATGELDDEIEGWATDAIEDIWAEVPRAPWNLKSGTFLARGRLAGTATWTLGQDSIVLNTSGVATQVLADEFVNGLINIGNHYVVTSYHQPSQTVRTATEIIDASGAASAYTFIQDMNTLPAVVDQVFTVRDLLQPRPITMLNGNQRRRLWPDPFLSIGADPREAWVRGVDEFGRRELGLYPPPSADRVYFFEFYRGAALPTKDEDELEHITGIPRHFHPVITARGKIKAFEFERESGQPRALVDFEWANGIKNMRKFRGANAGALRQVESDRVNRSIIFDNPDIREPTP